MLNYFCNTPENNSNYDRVKNDLLHDVPKCLLFPEGAAHEKGETSKQENVQ